MLHLFLSDTHNLAKLNTWSGLNQLLLILDGLDMFQVKSIYVNTVCFLEG